MAELLTIGEVSKRSGVAASALRFYEDRGLIESARAGSGHRRYQRSVLRRIAFIVFAQKVGLSLDEICKELAKLPANRAPNRRDWSRLSRKWSSRIDERIAELERLKLGLTECIGCGCLSLGAASSQTPAIGPRGEAPARATGSAIRSAGDAPTRLDVSGVGIGRRRRRRGVAAGDAVYALTPFGPESSYDRMAGTWKGASEEPEAAP